MHAGSRSASGVSSAPRTGAAALSGPYSAAGGIWRDLQCAGDTPQEQARWWTLRRRRTTADVIPLVLVGNGLVLGRRFRSHRLTLLGRARRLRSAFIKPVICIHSVRYHTVVLLVDFPLEGALRDLLHRAASGSDRCVTVPKLKPLSGQTCPKAFQVALDALDVVGQWEWDATTDRTRSDALVALLFNVDPEEAEMGLPLTAYIDAIHVEDRERVLAAIRRCAEQGSTYLNEYRVVSADGQTRWVLSRGRFSTNHLGRPVGGSGIFIDITRSRMGEGTYSEGVVSAEQTPLDRAAERAIAAQQAVAELQDPELKALADALLMALGRKLARQEVRDRRRRMT